MMEKDRLFGYSEEEREGSEEMQSKWPNKLTNETENIFDKYFLRW